MTSIFSHESIPHLERQLNQGQVRQTFGIFDDAISNNNKYIPALSTCASDDPIICIAIE